MKWKKKKQTQTNKGIFTIQKYADEYSYYFKVYDHLFFLKSKLEKKKKKHKKNKKNKQKQNKTKQRIA